MRGVEVAAARPGFADRTFFDVARAPWDLELPLSAREQRGYAAKSECQKGQARAVSTNHEAGGKLRGSEEGD